MKNKSKRKLTASLPNRGEEFDSGLIVEEPCVLVPRSLLDVFEAVQASLPSLEWLIYLRGEWYGSAFMLDEDYFIPSQEVTSASVDVDEEDAAEARRRGYNAVIHSHHALGLHSFSGVDDDYLADFDASLLYADGKIVHAVVRLMTPTGTWVYCRVPVEVERRNIVVEGLDRIKRKIYYYGRKSGDYFSSIF